MVLAVSQHAAVPKLHRTIPATVGRVSIPKLPSRRNVAFRNAAVKVQANVEASSDGNSNFLLKTYDFVRSQLPKLVGAVALAAVMVWHLRLDTSVTSISQ